MTAKITQSAREQDVQRDWYVVDAQGQTLGRLATQVATILKGKNKPFTSHANIPQTAEKYPTNPTSDQISIVYAVLNARSRVIPCCYYQGTPWQYTSKDFRVIDLAVARHKVKSGKEVGEDNTYGDSPTPMSRKVGVSDIADYSYIDSDHYAGGEGDNSAGYFKNILYAITPNPTAHV